MEAHGTQTTDKNKKKETVLVWMLSLNREYAKIEYDTAYQLCRLCFPNEKQDYKPANADSFRLLMTKLLPVLMMRHRRVPRMKWRDHITHNGKHWIEYAQPPPPNAADHKEPPPAIGYQLTYANSLCGMAVTQGAPAQVVTIGLGIKQLKVEPKGITVAVYLESFAHKLTQFEIGSITNNPEDVMLKRLCILIALKEAYMKALGQPVGFDYARLEFDVANRRASGDGFNLEGWEFRIFGAKLGVARGTFLKTEEYECVCAYYKGVGDTTFIFHDTPQKLENWVQFINIDQLMAVATKLAA